MNEDRAVELVGFLTRSKAIWTSPELLNLVESAPSPTKAFTVVLQHTGSQKKARAARWYACAIRDFGKDSLGVFASVLRSPQGAEKLERLLLTTSPKLEGRVKEKVMFGLFNETCKSYELELGTVTNVTEALARAHKTIPYGCVRYHLGKKASALIAAEMWILSPRRRIRVDVLPTYDRFEKWGENKSDEEILKMAADDGYEPLTLEAAVTLFLTVEWDSRDVILIPVWICSGEIRILMIQHDRLQCMYDRMLGWDEGFVYLESCTIRRSWAFARKA